MYFNTKICTFELLIIRGYYAPLTTLFLIFKTTLIMAKKQPKKKEKIKTTTQPPVKPQGLDWDAIKDQQEAIKTGEKILYKMQDIPSGGSTELRVLIPTQESMKRSFFTEWIQFWISGKPYTSLLSFGEDTCPLIEEHNAAKSSTNKEVKALMNHRDYQDNRKSFLFSVLRLSVSYKSDQMTIDEIKVVGGKANIFSAGRSVASGIIDIAAHPKNVRAGEGLSIMHRVLGRNITIEKSGAGLETEYKVQPDPSPLDLSDEQFDKYYEETPDIMGYLEYSRKSPEYLRAVIRNYLYAEPMPEGMEVEQATTSKKASTTKATNGGILNNIGNLDDE